MYALASEAAEWNSGDDIRTIDWKVSARAQGVYTKLFCEERERPCHILVDQRRSLYFGSSIQFKSTLAAELAAGIAWAALKGGDRVGGQVIGEYQESDSRARRSKQAVLRFIHDIHELNNQLAEAQDIEPSTLSMAISLEECRRITRPGTAIFIISDFHDFDHAAARALSNLGKHADLTLLQVSDKLEQKLPKLGSVAISNGRQSSKVNLSGTLTAAYQTSISERQNLLVSAATRARALYANINTSQTARQALIRLFTS